MSTFELITNSGLFLNNQKINKQLHATDRKFTNTWQNNWYQIRVCADIKLHNVMSKVYEFCAKKLENLKEKQLKQQVYHRNKKETQLDMNLTKGYKAYPQ
jgi:hypothetical protein